MDEWNDLSIAILAGGASTRMGRDKAMLPIGGESLLQSTARLALGTGAPLCIVGRERPQNWGFLDFDERVEGEALFLPDEQPGQGPLGGLLTALRWNALSIHRRPRLLVLPCDLPLLEAEALQWIAGASSTCSARDGFATTRNRELEPLFSVYFAAVEAHARKYLESGRRSLHGLIESGDFTRQECPPQVAAQIFNCNTPEQWREVTKASGKASGAADT